MGEKEERVLEKKEKRQEKLLKKYESMEGAGKFKKWRNERPFWGATLTLLAGLMVLYIPLQLYAIAFIPGSLVFVGFLFGGLILIVGTCAYFYPKLSTLFGVITIFLSVLSIMGALGGFIIGTIIGIIGGSLCIAWQQDEISFTAPSDKKRIKRRPKHQRPIENNQSLQA
ncbi:hypothetical protein SAMN05421676_10636 [Salinibacillus kushneri]|uniref:Uncharacterized protein n=1 Tax=Salinibacillus kushneri TaxID=237682 RepID=A0A1I0FPU1_9BACI|nr:DUF6114 domain-containing protein [Salinibacillus kushneri]SET60127.1 hypothetical protein SAMN05421676_10636 [Salinibacillus kushneri]